MGPLRCSRSRRNREVAVLVSPNGIGMAVYSWTGGPFGCHVHADLSAAIAERVVFCVDRKRLLKTLERCRDVTLDPDRNRLRFQWGRYKLTLATHSDEPTGDRT